MHGESNLVPPRATMENMVMDQVYSTRPATHEDAVRRLEEELASSKRGMQGFISV